MNHDIIPHQEIVSQIFLIRGRRVIFDFHIASLYEVETRALKQQVRRNADRFPEDFMFELTQDEWDEVIASGRLLNQAKFAPSIPFAFTEQGVAMLSGVLRSEKAIQINIAIMRAFVRMRDLLDESRDLRNRIDTLETRIDEQFTLVFDAIGQLVRVNATPRPRIGFDLSSEPNEA